MHNIVIDILPVALLMIFVWGTHPIKPISSINEDYLSIDTGQCYRGLLALVVVFHHLVQRTETGLSFKCFRDVGFLAVAMFFFFSGYGLLKSYIVKQEKYKKGFLLRRLLPILFLYVVMTALYWLMNFAGGTYYSITDIIIKIAEGSPIVSFSWYIICILAFYVAFWILMIICQYHYFVIICGGCLWYILYAAYCIKMGYSHYWFNTCELLIVGMFWAVYEEKIIEIIIKLYLILTPMTWLLFAVCFCFRGKIYSLIPITGISFLFTMLTAVLFVISVLLFSLKFQIGNKILRFLGSISLEIYLCQGLFITSLRSRAFYIQNELFWCVMVLTGTIIFAYILHVAFTAILKEYQLLLNKANI